MWTLQEICLAKRASIFYEGVKIPWSLLEMYTAHTMKPDIYTLWEKWQPVSEIGQMEKMVYMVMVNMVTTILEAKQTRISGGLSLSGLCM